MPKINMTEGCAHGCVYCYAQGYSNFPGAGHVVLGDNIPQLVRDELPRKRQRPCRVYFSSSSDAFQPLPEVLDVTYETMSILLDWGIEVAFLTKGVVDDRFLALFSQAPARVFAQIGLTTLNEQLWGALEPGTACPARRLQAIESLVRLGVRTKARLDPLIPGVTDTRENLVPLLAEMKRRGISGIAAGYLFLRPGVDKALFKQLRDAGLPTHSIDNWAWQSPADGIAGAQMMAPEDRKTGFDRLRALAANHGIEVHVCACKNPDLSIRSTCQIAGPLPAPAPCADAPLFHSLEF